jgi:hypothetical protein
VPSIRRDASVTPAIFQQPAETAHTATAAEGQWKLRR